MVRHLVCVHKSCHEVVPHAEFPLYDAVGPHLELVELWSRVEVGLQTKRRVTVRVQPSPVDAVDLVARFMARSWESRGGRSSLTTNSTGARRMAHVCTHLYLWW